IDFAGRKLSRRLDSFKVEDEPATRTRDGLACWFARRAPSSRHSTTRRDLCSRDGTRGRLRHRYLLQLLERGLRTKTSRQNSRRGAGVDRDRLRRWSTAARRNRQPHRLVCHDILCVGRSRNRAVVARLVCERARMRTVNATRYVTPLREGGSLPAIIEADDDGMYVLKFRGAGQGTKALIAEVIAGELARKLALPVPELVFVILDPEIAKTEPDPEIQDLIRASGGLNLGLDYLPGSVMFDPVAEKPEADLASRIVWFDAYVTNVDRTPRNANMLMWHRKLWLIDHGAALYFHHAWSDMDQRSKDPFRLIKEHILLPFATALETADKAMTAAMTEEVIKGVVDLVPDDWMNEHAPFSTIPENRQAYIDYLTRRLEAPRSFVEEAIRAR